MKNKIKISFVLLLSLLILFGFFFATFAHAEDPNETGTCKTIDEQGHGHIVITVRGNCPKTGPNKGVFEATPIMGTCTIVNAEGKAIPTQMTEQRCKDAKNNLPPGAIWKGWVIDPAYKGVAGENSDNYQLLQPLPCKSGSSENCVEDPNHPGQYIVKSIDVSSSCDRTEKLSEYVNFLITIFIALCAVAAVVMIVIGGIQYSTSELLGGKEEARSRILNAIFGLVLALGAYAILYTINPDLLKISIDQCPNKNIPIDNKVGLMYLNDESKEAPVPGNVNENSQIVDENVCSTAKAWGPLIYFIQPAYAFSATAAFCNIINTNGGVNNLNGCGAAKLASNFLTQEGKPINPALLLAIYGRETANGDVMDKPEKWCTPYGKGINTSHMNPTQRDILIRLYDNASFRQGYDNVDFDKMKVSCVAIRKGAPYGHGGALGHLQMMPDNWEKYGNFGNPNNLLDSMISAGRLVLANGSVDDIKNAACKYYSGHNCSNAHQCDDPFLKTKQGNVTDDAYGCWVRGTFDRVDSEIKSGASCDTVMDNLSRIQPPAGLIDFIDNGRKPFDPNDVLDTGKNSDASCFVIGEIWHSGWIFENQNIYYENSAIMRFTLPEGVDYVSSTEGHLEGKTLTFLLGTVAPGEKKQINFDVKVNRNAKSALVFSGTTTYNALNKTETTSASVAKKKCLD